MKELYEQCLAIMGAGPIREMSKEDMVKEIVDLQRVLLLTMDQNSLRQQLVHFRATIHHNKILAESGLDAPSPQLGIGHNHGGIPDEIKGLFGGGPYL